MYKLSKHRIAFLKFLPESWAILISSSSETAIFSFSAISFNTVTTSSIVGAPTRTSNVLDLIGDIMFEVELATMINLMFLEYFSIVLLSAAWASLLRESASLMTTTLKRTFPVWKSTCSVEAISLSKSWITTRSLLPKSLGVISKWLLEETTLNSSLRLEAVVNVLTSIFILSTTLPYNW